MSRREGKGTRDTVWDYDFIKFAGKRFAGAEKHQKSKGESIIKGVDYGNGKPEKWDSS